MNRIPVIFDAAANPVLHEEKKVKHDYVKELMSRSFAYRIVRKVIGALTVLACCGTFYAQANVHGRKAELNPLVALRARRLRKRLRLRPAIPRF